MIHGRIVYLAAAERPSSWRRWQSRLLFSVTQLRAIAAAFILCMHVASCCTSTWIGTGGKCKKAAAAFASLLHSGAYHFSSYYYETAAQLVKEGLLFYSHNPLHPSVYAPYFIDVAQRSIKAPSRKRSAFKLKKNKQKKKKKQHDTVDTRYKLYPCRL